MIKPAVRHKNLAPRPLRPVFSGRHGPAQPLLSILVVAYNSRDHILACLAAAARSAAAIPHEVLLIDNGQDGTAALALEHFPTIRVVPSRGNVGFARANNILAQSARGELLLLLNPDAIAEEDAIAALLACARRHPGAAAWGGATLTADGLPDMGNDIRPPSVVALLKRAIGIRHLPLPPASSAADAEVEVLCGGFALIHAEAWRLLGGFDEAFFLYSEEVDLFVRARRAGWSIWRTPMGRVVHFAGNGVTLSQSRLLFQATGQMHYLRKHWPRGLALAGGALVWLIAAQRFAAGRLLGARHPALRQLGEAYRIVATRPWEWFSGYDGRRWRSVRATVAASHRLPPA